MNRSSHGRFGKVQLFLLAFCFTLLLNSPTSARESETSEITEITGTADIIYRSGKHFSVATVDEIYLPLVGSNLELIPGTSPPSPSVNTPIPTPTAQPASTLEQAATAMSQPAITPSPAPSTSTVTAIVITATPTNTSPPPTTTSTPSPLPTTAIPPDPSVPDATAIRFAVVGDFGSGTPIEGNVADMIAAQNVDFITTVGDNRYNNNNYDFLVGQFYCDYMADVTSGPQCAGGNRTTNAFFPATGNHDYQEGFGIGEYLRYFTLPGAGIESSHSSGNERYYDAIQGPLHLFFIDSQGALNSSTEMAAQRNWLQSQLAQSTTPWQLVFLHHSPFSSSTQHGSNDNFQWPYAAWGADVVLTGHDHTYERVFQEGIVYFVNGLGGKSVHALGAPVPGTQFQFNGEFGAMIVDATAESLRFRFLDRLSDVHDDYTLIAPTASSAPTPPSSGSINVQISQSAGDAEERITDGTTNLTSTDLELIHDVEYWGVQKVGLQFANLQIPQNATITTAYIEFTTDESQTADTTLSLHAQSIDNAPAFSNTLFNISSRTTTATSIKWVTPAWDTLNATHRTPDISALVQEVVNRPGWQGGNNMAFIIDGNGHRTAESFDGGGDAPLLHVTYGD